MGGSIAEIIGAVQSTLGLIALCLMLVFALSSKLEQTHRLRIIYTLFAVIALLCTSLFLPYVFPVKAATNGPSAEGNLPRKEIARTNNLKEGESPESTGNKSPFNPAKAEVFDFGDDLALLELKSIQLGEKKTLSTMPGKGGIIAYTNVNNFCYYLSSNSDRSMEELPLGPREQSWQIMDQIVIYRTKKGVNFLAYISPEDEQKLKRFEGSLEIDVCSTATASFSTQVGIPVAYVKDTNCESIKDNYQREIYLLTLHLDDQ